MPPPACAVLQGCSNRLLGLGLFVVMLVLVWGFCYFFFPRLETKKTQEGKKCEKKPQIQARDAQHFQNTGLPQCPSNSSVSGAFFPPSEWLPPVLPLSLPCQFQQHRSLSLAAAARAGLCCVLSSCCCCIQLPDGFSSHLPGGGRRAQSSPPLWPGTASLSRTDQGQTNCPHGLGAAEPLAEPLWPNFSQAPPGTPCSRAAVLGLYPRTSHKDVSNTAQPLSHTPWTCCPCELSQGQIPGSSAQQYPLGFSSQPISSL